MIGVNLIPEPVLQLRLRKRRLWLWALIVTVVCLVGAFPVGVEVSRQRRLRLLRAERSDIRGSVKTTLAELNSARAEIRTLEAQAARADALRAKRSWSGLMKTLARALPEKMWLVSVATEPTAPRPGDRDLRPKPSSKPADPNAPKKNTVVTLEAPRALALDGFALEYRDLYDFMSRLKTASVFTEVVLTRASDAPVFDASAVRFRILCRW